MIFGFQIIGLLFGLVMVYFTFLYYKRANYDKTGLIFWFVVWLGFIILVMFPQMVYGVMGVLHIERTADFFYISGFLFFSVVLFYVYNNTKKNQKQLETLVRNLAFKQAKKKK
ncbi:DUF2304 domain-containing protein [Candidatus Woesearchaeota archaeon]|nr:DUF2304 domain-containing protein [Candidatus Woesearchaeota archaeon]